MPAFYASLRRRGNREASDEVGPIFRNLDRLPKKTILRESARRGKVAGLAKAPVSRRPTT